MSEEEIQEKQNYLRQNIMDAGYDTQAFVEFLIDKKGEDGADVANWSLPDLKNVVQEFISLHNGNSNNQQEEQNENVEKNEVNNEQNEIKQQPQQQNKKNQECSYGIVTKNEIHCMKALNNEITKCDNIQITVGSFEKVEGNFFSKSYVSYLVTTAPFNWNVRRRFSDFEWLRQTLVTNFNYCLIPSIPKKTKNISKMVGEKSDNDFLSKRSRNFEKFLNCIIIDPILKNTQIIYDFLSMEKDDEFQKMKKAVDKLKQPVFNISKAVTTDGNANIEINEEKEKYFNDIKESTNQKENILKKINATIKVLKDDLINASDKLMDISKNFNLIKENSIQYKEKEEVIKSYSEMSSMFANFASYLIKQKDVIFINLKEYFKFIKNNYRSMKDFVHKTENLKTTFYKSFKSLKTKKEDLFRRQEVTKWDLDPKDTSIDKNTIATNKNLALEKMLYKETLQVNYQKVCYGFYLNRIIKEHDRMNLNYSSHHHKHCVNIFEIMANNSSEFINFMTVSPTDLKSKQENENNGGDNMNQQNEENNNGNNNN